LLFSARAKFLVLTHAWSGHANSAERDKSDAPLRCYLGVTQPVPVNVADWDAFPNLPATCPHVTICRHAGIFGYFEYFGTDLELKVLNAVVMKTSIIWDITPCNPMKFDGRFG
jgi:hypothetical protein